MQKVLTKFEGKELSYDGKTLLYDNKPSTDFIPSFVPNGDDKEETFIGFANERRGILVSTTGKVLKITKKEDISI